DHPGCEEMPELMYAIFRFHSLPHNGIAIVANNWLPGFVAVWLQDWVAFIIEGKLGNAGRDLQRIEAAIGDIRVVLDMPVAVREHEIVIAFRAGEFPFAKGIDDHRRHRDLAITGFRLRGAKLAP